MRENPSSAAILQSCLSYDAGSGAIVRTHHVNPKFVGQRADVFTTKGYLIVSVHGVRYAAHRVAWLLQTGAWPSAEVDHINLVKTDNRFANLRIATRAQNQANVPGHGKCLKGVTHHKTGRYQAQIKVDGKGIYLGLYDTEEAAHQAYLLAAKQSFGEFARGGA